MNNKIVFGTILLAFLLMPAIAANTHLSSAYAPQKGDFFNYSETTTVNNGKGVYTGYTDQLYTTGMEQMNTVNGNLVSASYSYSYKYSNNQGSSTSSSSLGDYTWSSSNFTYVNGTDNQVGFGGISYSKPLYLWFAMNPSLSVGSTFYVLNTQFTVLSKNYTLQLPTENRFVQTIQTEGTGQYQRNDSYGVFTATYTWYEYFDPSTGYIVAYNYVEQDTGQYQGQTGSFTYTDELYVTSTSYSLTSASATSAVTTTSTTPQGSIVVLPTYLGYLAAIVGTALIVGVVVYAATRRRREKLPKHPYTPPPSPPSMPFPSKIDLGSKPPEQVVIKEVAKVNCRYCGTLIPTTADRCPYCGGPRQ
ncbi:MAG: hypothetical protein JRN52_15505 [Nitrososphaerota archaeon]|nr:hypothetical protein [Nitrososphaerota archaeon]